MVERKLLCDHPAHRNAEYMRLRQPDGLHESSRVVGHLPDRVASSCLVGRAGPAGRKANSAEMRLPLFEERLTPGRRLPAETPDQKQRPPRALLGTLRVD